MVMRVWAVVLLVAACGGDAGNSGEIDAAPRVPIPTGTAAELYGLRVGARWTYLRSGDVLRWKEITSCEPVLVIDPFTGEPRTEVAYVRENRSLTGITSIHYLIEDETGVRRIRRDDVDGGNFVMFATYEPANPRVLNGPYHEGEQRDVAITTAEYDPDGVAGRGASSMSAVDDVIGGERMVVVAGQFDTLAIDRHWASFTGHSVRSNYAPGVGEIREETRWPDTPIERIQIEELVGYTPGYATCDGALAADADRCREPLSICDDAWGSGRRGCTDPRVDASNCGGCGTVCPSGVCADGRCQVDGCATECEGATICCPSAWAWGHEGCTSPVRDRWNCGGCGIVCPDGRVCQHGACSCPPGTDECAGVCQPILEDPTNCGACGNVCPPDTICDKGLCVESCVSVDLTDCGGDCVDLMWNDDHCGSCDHPCGKGTSTDGCRFGECVPCEEAGKADCGGDCADLQWSDSHCGACGRSCATGETCVVGRCVGGDGSCAMPCAEANDICCEGRCVDPRTSDWHCGGCGVAQCTAGCTQACRNGVCTSVDCGGGDD